MAPRTLTTTASLQTLFEDIVYSEARLMGDSNAADLAAKMTHLFPVLEEARQMSHGVQRSAAQAQARVDGLNDEADQLVLDFEAELDHVLRDAKSPRYLRYFGNRPCWEVVRMGLEAQLEEIATWPASIATEPEEALKAFAPRFEDVLARGRAALAERTRIEGARKDFRTREKEALIAKLNLARMDLFGELFRRAVERKLPKSWADRFFRMSSRRSPANDEPVESPE